MDATAPPDATACTALDYPRVREIIAGFCVTPEGAAALGERTPLGVGEGPRIDSLKEETAEWMRCLRDEPKQAPLLPWPPIASVLPLLTVNGGALSLEQAHALRLFCHSAVNFRRYAAGTDALWRIAALGADLPDLALREERILAVIDKDGNLRDLPELRAIRRTIERLGTEVDQALRQHFSAHGPDVLQSTVPVLRDGRQVLAVKASRKNAIKGIIHAVSQSAQTVYVEPENVVRLHNDMAEETAHLEREIRRILADLTRYLAPSHPDLVIAHAALVHVDTTLAAARWGMSVGAIFAENATIPTGKYTPATQVRLIQARHPLLGSAAVPIDLCFDAGKRVMVISGPNTGGKTVAMKTFALCCLLNQSGFPVPAAEGTTLPLFDRVFVDIGDGQSIDASLSYFSAHITNIAAALAAADSRTLVLLDELGSATDPEEGGALSLAILDALVAAGSYALATTHHGAIKNYAFSHPLCQNVSASFDPEKMAPTYRFTQGAPGQSYAIDTAAHYGLPAPLIEAARRYFAKGSGDAASLIKALSEEQQKVAEIRESLENEKNVLYKEQQKLADKAAAVNQQERLLHAADERTLRQFTAAARSRLENLIRELREGEITREKTLAVKQFLDELAEAEEGVTVRCTATSLGGSGGYPPTFHSLPPGSHFVAPTPPSSCFLSPGVTVRLKNHPGVSGTILESAGSGQWLVQASALRLTLHEGDLEGVSLAPVRATGAVTPTTPVLVDWSDSALSRERPPFEVRLLGLRAADALKVLEHQVDLAAFHGLAEFAVIHGKGDGILQEAVWRYLEENPVVASCRFAPPEDGGTGKTYVTLGKRQK